MAVADDKAPGDSGHAAHHNALAALANDNESAIAALQAVIDGRLSETQLAATIASSRVSAFMSAHDATDGLLPEEGFTDSGHPYTSTIEGGSTGLTIAGEWFTASGGRSYLNLGPLPAEVSEIRMRVKWTDEAKGTDNPAVMIVAEDLFHPASGTGSVRPNAGAHVLIYPNRMQHQKRPAEGGGSTVTVKQVYFSTPLEYGVEHEVAILWDGQRMWFRIPNGQTFASPVDSDVKDWWGNFATLEIVGDAASNAVAIKRDWEVSTSARSSPRPQVGKLIYHHETTGTASDGSELIPISTNTLLFVSPDEVLIPETQQVYVVGSVYVQRQVPTTQATALLNLKIGVGSVTYTTTLNVINGTTRANNTGAAYWDGEQLHFAAVVDASAFSVGVTQTVGVWASATSGMFRFVDQGGGSTTALARRSWLDVYEYGALT